MVRVGGGWSALEEFLAKNDPCRGMSNSCHSFFVNPFSEKTFNQNKYVRLSKVHFY